MQIDYISIYTMNSHTKHLQHFPKVSEKKENPHKTKIIKKKKAKNKYIVIKPKEMLLNQCWGEYFKNTVTIITLAVPGTLTCHLTDPDIGGESASKSGLIEALAVN